MFPEQGLICGFLALSTIHFFLPSDGGQVVENFCVQQFLPVFLPMCLYITPYAMHSHTSMPLHRLFPQQGSAFPSILWQMWLCSLGTQSKFHFVGDLLDPSTHESYLLPPLGSPVRCVHLLESLYNSPSHLLLQLGVESTSHLLLWVLVLIINIITTGL